MNNEVGRRIMHVFIHSYIPHPWSVLWFVSSGFHLGWIVGLAFALRDAHSIPEPAPKLNP